MENRLQPGEGLRISWLVSRISDKRQAAGAKHRSTERISSDDYSDHRYIEQGWDVLAWLLLDCRGVTSSLPKGVV